VQKSNQALKSVKGPGNTFDWNPKWARTLPTLIYFSWNIYKKKLKYQSWYLTPYWGLEVQKHTQALQSVNGLGYTFDLNPKWERTMPSIDIYSWVIYRVPPNPNIKVVYRDRLRNILGGGKWSVPLRMRYWKWRHRKRPWPEMTSHEVTWPKWRHNRKYVLHMLGRPFPRFFSYHSSSTKCTIVHDRK
jgi:hypothetical protein